MNLDLPDNFVLYALDLVDSTNVYARTLVPNGKPAVVWAKKQTEGKGRQGRNWVSVEGNLFATILFFPAYVLPNRLPEISYFSALAAAEALLCLPAGEGWAEGMFVGQAEEATPRVEKLLKKMGVQFKWPNDILINGKKLGGILLETGMFQGERFMLVGLGMNITSSPSEVMYPATHLKAEGIDITVERLLSGFVTSFEMWYKIWERKGFMPIRDSWIRLAKGIGNPIKIQEADKLKEGIFRGIARDGSLQLELANGEITAVLAGDVMLQRQV